MLFKPTQLLGLSAILLAFSSQTVLASIPLRKEVRALDSYQFLPLCQQTCIAGDSNSVYNNVGDWTSVIGATNCETKECFCVASNQAGIAERVKACLAKTTKCANPTELNGAMTFLGNWCGFPSASVDTASSVSVSTILPYLRWREDHELMSVFKDRACHRYTHPTRIRSYHRCSCYHRPMLGRLRYPDNHRWLQYHQ